jgi:hypothetical protein
MRKDDVPQDAGLWDERWHRINYAVDEQGRYVQVQSAGCESVNITNSQAWEVINKQIEEAKKHVIAGKLSPLAFYMAVNQMDIRLLSQYVGMFKWRVRRHLKPKVFAGLNPSIIQRYAKVFNISVGQLLSLIDTQTRDAYANDS